ncbi:MAG: glycosyltransferase [Cytophagales bacterium]
MIPVSKHSEEEQNRIPLVSVVIATYNHEAFIRECLDGILMQKTNFNIEILVNEDCSTDQTADILREYEAKHPRLFRIFYQTENQYSKGVKPWFDILFPISRGKYIALCDGDDFWTDDTKLQKQVNFMEANSDFAICFHRVQIKHIEDSSKNYLSREEPLVTTELDLALINYIYTSSCLFVNNLIKRLPKSIYISPAGDYFLHMLNAKFGKIRFLNEVMAVYRIHNGGSWGSKPSIIQEINWIKTQNLVSTEVSRETKLVIKDVLKEKLNNLGYLYHSETIEDKEIFERMLDSVMLNYLSLWKDFKMSKDKLEKQRLENNVLKNQIERDFKKPLRAFLRSIYYKIIGKKMFR